MQSSADVTRLIYFGAFFSALRMLVGGVSALYLISKGVSLQEIGILKSFQAGVIFVFDAPLAYIADRYSRTMSIKLAVLFSAAWLLVTAVSSDFEHFLLAELLNALSLALFNGAFLSYLLSNTGKEEKKPILSRYTKIQHVLMALFALLGPMTIETVSSSFLWYYASVAMFFWFFMSFVLIEKEKSKERSVAEEVAITVREDLKKAVSAVVNMKVLMVFVVSFGVFYQVLIQFWQPVLKNAGGISDHAYLWGVIFFLVLSVQSLSGYLSEKRTRMILPSIWVFTFALIAIWLFAESKELFFTALILIIFLFSGFSQFILILFFMSQLMTGSGVRWSLSSQR
ncbi:MFS transporter [Kiloniella sp. b19]|uniref:MFS transporter n=1 Tax=Kiloniella sp. GXU_MW_B19 TaxID=3141326 RepID=UPI0031D35AFF